jgi:hypothetical protein
MQLPRWLLIKINSIQTCQHCSTVIVKATDGRVVGRCFPPRQNSPKNTVYSSYLVKGKLSFFQHMKKEGWFRFVS